MRAEGLLHAAGGRYRERHGDRRPLRGQPRDAGRDRGGRSTRGAGRVPTGGVVLPPQQAAETRHDSRAGEVGTCAAAGGQHRGHDHDADVRRGIRVQIIEVQDVADGGPPCRLGQARRDGGQRVVAGGEGDGRGIDQRALRERQIVGFRPEVGRPPREQQRAVFKHRLYVHVALSGPWLRAKHVGKESFRCFIAVKNVVLAALFEIDHELHGDAGVPRPTRIGWFAAVTDKVARIF